MLQQKTSGTPPPLGAALIDSPPSWTKWLTRLYEIRPAAHSKLAALEGIRGFSVLLVFCVHVFGLYLSIRTGRDPDAASLQAFNGIDLPLAWLFFSHHGVYIFFVLSGFLIGRLLQRPDFEFGTFVRHRVLRIYPAFIASLALAIYYKVEVSREMTLSPQLVVQNLLLLNGLPVLRIPAYNPVTWSLFNEFAFYVSFASVIAMLGRQVISRWWQLIAAALALVFLPYLVGYVDARFLFFFFGLWIAGRNEAHLTEIARTVPGGYVVAFYLFAAISWPVRLVEFGTFIFFFGIATVLLIVKCCYGQGVLRRAATWTPLRYLGNISYSFYLVHGIVIQWLASLLQPAASDGVQSIALFAAVAFFVSWLVATALYAAAERPYFRRRISHKRPVATTLATDGDKAATRIPSTGDGAQADGSRYSGSLH